MVKFYASAKFAVDTKKRFKVHFSVWNWRLSQTEWRLSQTEWRLSQTE